MLDKNEAETIQSLLERAQNPIVAGPSARPVVILPPNHSVALLEHLLARPSRKTGSAIFTRAASFCEYVNEQRSEDARLYVTDPITLVAVLNHHACESSEAGWQDHRATLKLTKTQEWLTWNGSNLGRKNQRDFAQFIEDNSDDIVQPKGAELLDLVRTIKASQNLECTGDIDERGAQTGASFVLITKTKTGAKGELELPSEFILAIAPYEGCNKIPIKTKLRMEICSPRLTLWYELVKAQKAEKEALENIVAGVEKDTEMTAWYGTP